MPESAVKAASAVFGRLCVPTAKRRGFHQWVKKNQGKEKTAKRQRDYAIRGSSVYALQSGPMKHHGTFGQFWFNELTYLARLSITANRGTRERGVLPFKWRKIYVY